jgi:Tfp pilus assembly protein PilE
VNPKAVAVLVIIAVVAVALLAWLAYWSIRRVAGVRRRDMKLMRETLLEIEDAADRFRDIDSVLATEVRAIIRKTRTERNHIQ